MRSFIGISALAVLAACAPSPEPATGEAYTAVQPSVAYMQGGGGLSPRVRATWFAEGRDDTADLLLLVLWRGTPGWQNAPHHGSGQLPPRSSEGAPERRGAVPSPIVHTTRIGTVEFGIDFDLDSRTVRLIGEEVALGDRNVILVDRIDGAGGPPRIVSVLRIDPRLPMVRRPEPEGMRGECLAISWSAGDSMKRATPVECPDRPPRPEADIQAAVRQSPRLRAFVGPGWR